MTTLASFGNVFASAMPPHTAWDDSRAVGDRLELVSLARTKMILNTHQG